MIVDPPGVPITMKGLLSLRTIVGVIELSILLFGAIAFALLPVKP